MSRLSTSGNWAAAIISLRKYWDTAASEGVYCTYMKNLIITLLVLTLGAGLLVLAYTFATGSPTIPAQDTATTTPAEILSFEDCEAAGLPVMESNPRQCRTPDGRLYAEELPVEATYTNVSADRIRIDTPFPGAVTGKIFEVKGEVRGGWYFEASFPIQVLRPDGSVLVNTYATATADWMVDEFVPFTATVIVPEDYIGPATLVLQRDNASGLPEHDASVSFPITIEY